MISILSRLFIKNRTEYGDSVVRRKYGTLTGIVGIFLNIVLFTGKFIAGMISGAISITADAFNNLSDAGSSIISLLGFQVADKKPDSKHPYGHGRMEYVAGLLVSILIIIMGFELGKTSFQKIFNPEPLSDSTLTLIILIVAIAVKIYMFAYNRHYSGKINSASMKATALDSLSDSVATTVVFVSVLIDRYTGLNIDAYAGMLVSVFILFAGLKSIKEMIDPLLGQPPEPEYVKKIRDITLSYDEIIGVHDLVVHDYGPGRRMVSLHGEVPEDGDINILHDAIDRCERELRKELGCEATIHMDPIAVNNEKVNALKELVKAKIKAYNERISIHDFRVVSGDTHTNIIFDAVIPADCKESENEVKEKLVELVSELPGNCMGVIDIDREYTRW